MKLLVEITEMEVTRRYLAQNGLVAIDRELANDLAKCDGGVASHLMVYDSARDRYQRAQAEVNHG